VAWTPLGWSKGLILIIFLLLAGPVTSHALSSAAYRSGIPFAHRVRDDLAASGGEAPAEEIASLPE
jgi:multisubunit Na+/H+ antiporter MnhG subunit